MFRVVIKKRRKPSRVAFPRHFNSSYVVLTIQGLITLLLARHGVSFSQNVSVALPSLNPVVISVPRITNQTSATEAPLGAGFAWQFDASDLLDTANDRIDDFLSRRGIASTDAASSLGLAPGVGLRGFAVSSQATPGLTAPRLYLNGHADIAYRFVRDLSTVESATVMAASTQRFWVRVRLAVRCNFSSSSHAALTLLF